jgi:ribosome biogenesis GTPase
MSEQAINSAGGTDEVLDATIAAEPAAESLNGTVVSQQANFFYVMAADSEGGTLTEYACHMRGRLKKEGDTAYVGDQVVITPEPPAPDEKLPPPREGSLALPESSGQEPGVRKGFIDQILPRKTLLSRPTIANVDQVLLVFAADQPEFNPFLLDKFLVLTADSGYGVVIVINKRDLVPPDVLAGYVDAYRSLGYPVVATEASQDGVAELLPLLEHQVTVLAGPSGVGKSSILNAIQPGLALRTAEVSDKLQRGRHTTRHAALFPVEAAPGALVADTPGFSFLEMEAIEPANLGWYFPEMREHIPNCRFPSCLHDQEPDCAVKADAPISEQRYESYLRILDEVQVLHREAADRSKKEAQAKRRIGRQGQETRMVKVDSAAREGDRRTQKQRLLAQVNAEEHDQDDLDAEDGE